MKLNSLFGHHLIIYSFLFIFVLFNGYECDQTESNEDVNSSNTSATDQYKKSKQK